jgi:hypothetical protein
MYRWAEFIWYRRKYSAGTCGKSKKLEVHKTRKKYMTR